MIVTIEICDERDQLREITVKFDPELTEELACTPAAKIAKEMLGTVQLVGDGTWKFNS